MNPFAKYQLWITTCKKYKGTDKKKQKQYFTFITYLLLEFLQQNIYPLEVIKKKEESTNSYNHPYSPKFRKLWYSFVYTGTIFFGLTLKIDHFKFDPRPRNVIGTFYLLFMYVLGILCLAYMANFVIQQ